MGNCLVIEGKDVIKIMRIDGKILEYKSPMKVQQVLSEYPGHLITDTLPVARHLDPMEDMRDGHLYYLLRAKKGQQMKAGVVRVKVVIRKQELKEILEREGLTLEDMMSQVQRKTKIPGNIKEDRCMGWKPDLESILEENDIYLQSETDFVN
ncbi:uncharacterized protein M6B38_412355 [Iris pallida]|uniref:Uncharacterized protein n=1 Tax=Iris pallida TaxID=29817 RepID=A0AAX6FN47_IRIPA|nr:uncharacterized protein M6B38_214080 [Iris pallida]KAJ6817341.1 uncharacterized protein M6B38_412355 [Iris pallida]